MSPIKLTFVILALSFWAPPPPVQAQFFPSADTLVLDTCDSSGGSTPQMFNFVPTSISPTINTIVHEASGLCVEAFQGSDYGSPEVLSLRTCIAGHALQLFTYDTVAQTIRNNYTAIIGCLGWNMYKGGPPTIGQKIGPYQCGPPNPNELFILNSVFQGAIEKLNVDGTPSGLCIAVQQPTATYILDDTAPNALGPIFDGIGVVSGAGTSRLLYDYPATQRDQILDALFSPTMGAGIHMLKIEIGGDGMGTMGSESSHQHYAGEPSGASTRGTQVWLAQQAKERNPNLKLYALPWSWPSWLRNSPGDTTPYGNPTQAATYIVTWLQTVQQNPGLTFDYVGVWSDIWDPVLSPPYVKALYTALQAAGFTNTKIVCADVNDWSCATAALADADLMNAVGVFGDHGIPSIPDPNTTGKTLWRSWMNIGGAATLKTAPWTASVLNSNFLKGNLTGSLTFAGVGSTYNTLPEWNEGLILADQPWDGFFRFTPLWYVIAHTSQFTKPGWKFLNVGPNWSGSGSLQNGGSWVTYVDTAALPGSMFWAAVFAKMNDGDINVTPELATISLKGTIQSSSPVVYVMTSCFGATGTNVSLFQGPTSVAPDGNGMVNLWLDVNCLYTVTNVAGTGVSPAFPPPGVPTPFPLSGSDDFTQNRVAGNPPMYWADMNGAFEIVDDPVAGRVLQQRSAGVVGPQGAPITRRNTDTTPHTVMGNPIWEDIDFNINFLLPSSTDVAGVCVRCNSFNDTEGIDGSTGVDNMPGIWVFLSLTTWSLTYDLRTTTQPASTGTYSKPFNINEWHNIRLVSRGDSVIAILDGFVLFRQNVSYGASSNAAPSQGQLGLASGGWGQYPIFGKYSYTATKTSCDDMPQAGQAPLQEACAVGTSEQQFAFVLAPSGNGPQTGQFQVVANNSLCLQQNSSADPVYRYQNTRAVTVQPCDPAEPKQQFMIETTMQDGGMSVGPVQGIDGLTLNIYGNSDDNNEEVNGYEYQGGTNSLFYWDAPTGTLYAPFMGNCVSLCSAQ